MATSHIPRMNEIALLFENANESPRLNAVGCLRLAHNSRQMRCHQQHTVSARKRRKSLNIVISG